MNLNPTLIRAKKCYQNVLFTLKHIHKYLFKPIEYPSSATCKWYHHKGDINFLKNIINYATTGLIGKVK